jgi:RNA polymerase sigma factor (sigma-70 family)
MAITGEQNMEEQQLWNSFIEGNNNSLETIYRRYFDDLFNYGNKWLKDTTLTEDSIQDLFIKLLKNRHNLSSTTSIRYYLYRSFRSTVLDKIKSNNKARFVDSPGEHLFLFELSPENQLIAQQEHHALRNKLTVALKTLTPRQREVIFLRYIEGFSYQEVADMMDLTAKGTYKLVARAIEALKDQMTGATTFLILELIAWLGSR